jgi:aspartate aminotransferase
VPHPTVNALNMRNSGIREIVNLVLASPGGIARLEVGEPGFATPEHIVAAAMTAASSWTGYTHSAGTHELRSEIATSLGARYDLDVAAERIIVAQGAGQGLSAIYSVVLAQGDEVLIPDPSWPNYAMLTTLHGARPVAYSLPEHRGFMPDLDELASLVTPLTRAIVINSPGNPTGAVMPRGMVRRIAEFAAERDILLISDEVYDQLIFEGEPSNAAGFGLDNVVSVFSFSKTYAMTGWRVGYIVAPTWLADLLAHVQEPLLSCISSVSQSAALAALRGPQDVITMMRDAYRSRRDLAVRLLTDGGVAVQRPAGAFYLMVPIADGADSRAAALDLVTHGVAVAPGTAFGAVAASQLRLSLASEAEVIETGIARFLEWNTLTEGGLVSPTLAPQDNVARRKAGQA